MINKKNYQLNIINLILSSCFMDYYIFKNNSSEFIRAMSVSSLFIYLKYSNIYLI